MSELQDASFAARYRLEPRDARVAIAANALDNAPYLVGLGLLEALCATTSLFGTAGMVAEIAIPGLVLWWFLAGYRRVEAAIRARRGAELGASFNAEGLTLETPLSKIELAWTGVSRIQRRRGAWTFTSRAGNRFNIPIRAIPVNARAPIARWAAAGKARLD